MLKAVFDLPADFMFLSETMSSARSNLALGEMPPEVKPIEINTISVLQKAHVSTNRALPRVYTWRAIFVS